MDLLPPLSLGGRSKVCDTLEDTGRFTAELGNMRVPLMLRGGGQLGKSIPLRDGLLCSSLESAVVHCLVHALILGNHILSSQSHKGTALTLPQPQERRKGQASGKVDLMCHHCPQQGDLQSFPFLPPEKQAPVSAWWSPGWLSPSPALCSLHSGQGCLRILATGYALQTV